MDYDRPGVDRVNREAVAFLEELRETAGGDRPVVISGCLGPHDDGYAPGEALGVDEAQAHHSPQIETFSDTAADVVSAITMTYVEEAVGVARVEVGRTHVRIRRTRNNAVHSFRSRTGGQHHGAVGCRQER